MCGLFIDYIGICVYGFQVTWHTFYVKVLALCNTAYSRNFRSLFKKKWNSLLSEKKIHYLCEGGIENLTSGSQFVILICLPP